MTRPAFSDTVAVMTHPPSYWLKLLQERAGIISSFKQGLTDEEFDLLCKKDAEFQKNIGLEMKDLLTIVTNLNKSIETH